MDNLDILFEIKQLRNKAKALKRSVKKGNEEEAKCIACDLLISARYITTKVFESGRNE